MLLHKKRRKAAAVRVGVCAIGRNMGTTTVCIAVSNYLCSKKRRSTAYVEYNSTGEIRFLSGKQDSKPFILNDIRFFPEMTACGLTSTVSRYDPEFCVIDYGVFSPGNREDFLRCDYRLLLFDPSPWKKESQNYLGDLLSKDRDLRESITLLGNPGSCLRKRTLLSEFGLSVLSIPFFSNPFQLTSDQTEVFDRIFKGV